jgi:hypothetical protein
MDWYFLENPKKAQNLAYLSLFVEILIVKTSEKLKSKLFEWLWS